MNVLAQLFLQNKKVNLTLLVLSIYCFGLLLFRAKITNSTYLFFLVWNLVLAVIPYLITTYLTVHTVQRKIIYALLLVWLLFIPNSFYIITDLVHVVRSEAHLFYFDLLLICSFAVSGFLLGILSLQSAEIILQRTFQNQRFTTYVIPMICFLNGFGIYIGRELRFNSWDIISNPIHLMETLYGELFSTETIVFSIHFGTFIYLAFLVFKNITSFSHDQATV
jgi:uncharacterized membrane protein